MTESAAPIAVIQGGSSATIQQLLDEFASSLRPVVRVAGLIEEGPKAVAQLRSLGDGRRYPLFQDLGPSSTACSLDGGSVVMACEAVRRDIAAGCDLVVLSKFGKLEAERSGLAEAFAAAVEAQVPILTSLAPKFDAQWTAFAAPMFEMLSPEAAAIERWWRSVAPVRLRRGDAARLAWASA